MVRLQGRKLHKNISVMVSWNVSIRKTNKRILFLMKHGKDPWENMNINYCFFALNCEQRCSRNHDVGHAIVFVYPFEPTRSDVN